PLRHARRRHQDAGSSGRHGGHERVREGSGRQAVVNPSPSATGPPPAGAKGRWPQSPDAEIHAGGLFEPGRRFGRAAPLEVEIGSGKARFLLEAARRAPAHDFLGIELSLAYYRICRERVARSGASNVRVVRADGRRFVETALAPRSIHAFHIYFPDPW